jgi:hypothetical protein
MTGLSDQQSPSITYLLAKVVPEILGVANPQALKLHLLVRLVTVTVDVVEQFHVSN